LWLQRTVTEFGCLHWLSQLEQRKYFGGGGGELQEGHRELHNSGMIPFASGDSDVEYSRIN
jgi:hypothetical protein